MLAARNPVVGEFMRALLLARFNLSVRNTTVVACPVEARLADVTTTARYGIVPRLPRRDAACTRIPRTTRPINTMVDPDAGRTIAL
jgi:hypothetical protein